MLNKLIKYSHENSYEIKPSNGGGLLIFVKWEERNKIKKHLKKIKARFTTRYSFNYDYEIFSVLQKK